LLPLYDGAALGWTLPAWPDRFAASRHQLFSDANSLTLTFRMSATVFARRLTAAAVIASATILFSHHAATSAPAGRAAPFHLELLRSEPAVNEALTASPKQLKLWFSESIELKGTSVRLTDARNEAVKLGKLSVDTAPLAPPSVGAPNTLSPGKYLVTWRAAGDDGHPSTGKFSFTMK